MRYYALRRSHRITRVCANARRGRLGSFAVPLCDEDSDLHITTGPSPRCHPCTADWAWSLRSAQLCGVVGGRVACDRPADASPSLENRGGQAECLREAALELFASRDAPDLGKRYMLHGIGRDACDSRCICKNRRAGTAKSFSSNGWPTARAFGTDDQETMATLGAGCHVQRMACSASQTSRRRWADAETNKCAESCGTWCGG